MNSVLRSPISCNGLIFHSSAQQDFTAIRLVVAGLFRRPCRLGRAGPRPRRARVPAGDPGLTVGPVGIIWPQALRPIFVAWMVLAFPIGWTMSQVILGLMFYGVFTPIALIFRIIGRDPLQRARPQGVTSYWTPKATPADPRRYFKQF